MWKIHCGIDPSNGVAKYTCKLNDEPDATQARPVVNPESSRVLSATASQILVDKDPVKQFFTPTKDINEYELKTLNGKVFEKPLSLTSIVTKLVDNMLLIEPVKKLEDRINVSRCVKDINTLGNELSIELNDKSSVLIIAQEVMHESILPLTSL